MGYANLYAQDIAKKTTTISAKKQIDTSSLDINEIKHLYPILKKKRYYSQKRYYKKSFS
jgi:hypothetical protein